MWNYILYPLKSSFSLKQSASSLVQLVQVIQVMFDEPDTSLSWVFDVSRHWPTDRPCWQMRSVNVMATCLQSAANQGQHCTSKHCCHAGIGSRSSFSFVYSLYNGFCHIGVYVLSQRIFSVVLTCCAVPKRTTPLVQYTTNESGYSEWCAQC